MNIENPQANALEKAKQQKEWSKFLCFDSDANIIAQNNIIKADRNELKDLTTAFNDYDTTVGNGLTLDGENYDVHRFYETLIYGRRGDSENGEGIGVCKCIGAKSKKAIFTLITYGFPTLSARAVPQLRDFTKEHVEPHF